MRASLIVATWTLARAVRYGEEDALQVDTSRQCCGTVSGGRGGNTYCLSTTESCDGCKIPASAPDKKCEAASGKKNAEGVCDPLSARHAKFKARYTGDCAACTGSTGQIDGQCLEESGTDPADGPSGGESQQPQPKSQSSSASAPDPPVDQSQQRPLSPLALGAIPPVNPSDQGKQQ
eukprot:TRINITY_DN122212_c0_g1_i1.p1 TRINITY_DN122212_c0_g1~~TRINITY_DN122212_c0_g1_i1.p1  ORF type:complete len:177 (+),score=23.12 TRINITY_DN122212_c0_g1_i1:72-602(+)